MLIGNGIYSRNFKVYQIRWLMLYLLTMCSICAAMQSSQYSIIANVIVEFYDVSYEAVQWTVMVMMVIYIPFNFLGVYIIDKIGSRKSILLGIFGASAAAWIKVAAVHPNRIWVVHLGQCVLAISHVFILPLPVRFASAWFGKQQVALASSIGVSGIQLGVAIGFLLPPILVKFSKNKNVVAYQLFVMNIGVAVISTAFAVLTFVFFKSEPPSRAQQQMQGIVKQPFKETSKRLFCNVPYVVFLLAYGLSGGVYGAIATLLNQIVLYYNPDETESAGRVGLIMLLTGVLGAGVFGFILDKYRRFRMITIMVHTMLIMGMACFTLAVGHSLTMLYIASALLGFFMTAANTNGRIIAAELTYPISESTSSGYLLIAVELSGIIVIHLCSFIFNKFGPMWANVLNCIIFAISAVLTVCIPYKLQREAAQGESLSE